MFEKRQRGEGEKIEKKESSYVIEREFLGQITVRELLLRIIRAHRRKAGGEE